MQVRFAFVLASIFFALVPTHVVRAQEVAASAAVRDANQAAKLIAVPKGLKISVWATEPLLENGVAFSFDEKGRAFVAETHRLDGAVLESRGRARWPSPEFKKTATPERLAHIGDEILDSELAARTVADREAEVKKYFVGSLDRFTKSSERVKLVIDSNGDGVADDAKVFAEGFNSLLDGVGSGVLARKGDVFFTDIPSLWRLRDSNGDGVADDRKQLSYGYGVRYGFIGHDLHGLRIGPDGKLYFSIGDRGAAIETEGRVVDNHESGGVFRCNLDGSELEVVATGLRNPQELVFDKHGDLFTGDNNSDAGDKARLVNVVEGGDGGWRVGYQYIEAPVARGPWNEEKLWYPAWQGQAAYIAPPIANITSGPSGIAYYPGVGGPSSYKDHFFLVDFRGQASISGIWTFSVAPKGAGFSIVKPEKFAWGVLATDVDFGPDSALYILDWVYGWSQTGKGRLYRVADPKLDGGKDVAATRALIADGMGARPEAELVALLGHPDMRVRQEAQFQLVDNHAAAALLKVATAGKNPLARLHAVWGLGQLIRARGVEVVGHPDKRPAPQATPPADVVHALVKLLGDKDADVRGAGARVLGDGRRDEAFTALVKALGDATPRVRFHAALALGKLGRKDALPALATMLRANADSDPYLRHAGVMALTWIDDREGLGALARDTSPAVRMGALLAMRRLGDARIAAFLNDDDATLVREAARAISDVPIEGAVPALAAMQGSLEKNARVAHDPVVLARVINAGFRAGSKEAALHLAAIARTSAAPAESRSNALLALADWSTPSGRDRVTGLWRPLPPHAARDVAAARAALVDVLPAVLADAPDMVLSAALVAAQAQHVDGVSRTIAALVGRAKVDGAVRLAGLRALDDMSSPDVAEGLAHAEASTDVSLRLEALKLRVKRDPASVVRVADDAFAHGGIPEKQVMLHLLATATSPEVDQRLLTFMDELLAGKLAPELTLDVLEAASKRKDERLKAKLAAYEAARPKDDDLAPFRETLAGGDPARGKNLFWRRDDLSCPRCHALEGHGAEVGPELSGVGTRRPREFLLESVVYPSKHFAPGFESVLVTMKDGAIHGGTVKKDTSTTLQLSSPEEGQVQLRKAAIKTREPGASGMPDGFGQILSKHDLRDLIAFLTSLK